MFRDYQQRFGDMPIEEALSTIVYSLYLEATSFALARSAERRVRLGYNGRLNRQTYAKSNHIVVEIHRLLGDEALIPSHEISALPEIVEAIDAVSKKTGIDYSWVKKVIGSYPHRFAETGNLTMEQRELLSRGWRLAFG